MKPKSIVTSHFTTIKADISAIDLPDKFTFPFYYEAHPLAVLASEELQAYLNKQTDFEHNFGLDEAQKGTAIGKMFGVLVVQNEAGELGYISAFSGKLADANNHRRFVPPVFDMLDEQGFYKTEERVISAINDELDILLVDENYLAAKAHHEAEKALAALSSERSRTEVRAAKKARKARRKEGEMIFGVEEIPAFLDSMKKESFNQQYYHKRLLKYWEERLGKSKAALDVFQNKIDERKLTRKTKSAALQERLFDNYTFLNALGEQKSLASIFLPTHTKRPIAGAGECAAPKLIQYAYLNNLKPVCLAEFWWGASPNSEIRKHANYYPACRGKCQPILGHMLQGIKMDENPMLTNPAIGKTIETVYEDEHMLIINKPAEFLSVPGRSIEDSVQFRMKEKYKDATGPMIAHRLDMSTSGLILIGKTLEVYKHLQSQFVKRKVQKRYVALLDGIVEGDSGLIDLPLALDITDRPRQLVNYDYGKPAQTKWEVIERKNSQTRIHFYPITGRTHQLRVHAAHPQGLNIPIIGDDLYGTRAERLCLHAEWIAFMHPVTKERMEISVEAEF